MIPRHFIGLALQTGASALAIFMCAAPAKAEPSRPKNKEDVRICTTAYKDAQENEQSGHLVEASALYLMCAQEGCGSPLWQECTNRRTQLRAEIPSVVPLVTDSAGQPRVNVQVRMDGELLTSRIDGRGLAIDPGVHDFSFANEDGVFATERVTILQGQRNRTLTVVLKSADKRERKQPLADSEKSARPPAGSK